MVVLNNATLIARRGGARLGNQGLLILYTASPICSHAVVDIAIGGDKDCIFDLYVIDTANNHIDNKPLVKSIRPYDYPEKLYRLNNFTVLSGLAIGVSCTDDSSSIDEITYYITGLLYKK